MVCIVMVCIVMVCIVLGFFAPMRVRMLGLVHVAVDLVDKESGACQHKPCVGQGRKPLKGLGSAPGLEDPEHHGESGHLTQLYTDIECENPRDQSFVTQWQFLEPSRQAEAVDETEHEHHGQEVGSPDAERLFKSAQVLEALVDHAEGNDGIDEVCIGRDASERRAQ